MALIKTKKIMQKMNYQKFSLLCGFSVWLVGTLAVRYFGDSIFQINNNYIVYSLFLGAIPALYLISSLVFNLYKLSGETKLKSSVLMTVPGMICDVACIKFHFVAFPLLSIEQSILMASWVLWVYVIVLLNGLIKL